MNPRHEHEHSPIVPKRPVHYASQISHYETALAALQNTQALATGLIAFVSFYLILDYFGFAPLSVLQLSWKSLVYLTPSRLVVALDPCPPDLESPNPTDSPYISFEKKNAAMQRIFGIDTSHLASSFRRRSLTGLGNALLGTTKEAKPPGLGNWDNSCYQNSIIQGLASLESLAGFLVHNVTRLSDKTYLSKHEALSDIIACLNNPSNNGTKLWIPADLKSMSSWQQQDAQEYFSKLVDQIDLEIQLASHGETSNMGLKIAGREENIVRDGSPEPSTSEGSDSPAKTSGKASCRNPLEGLLAQRVGCMECGWTEGLSLIPFNCLTVPLGAKFEYDLVDCLDQYMTLEPIDGVECAKCTLLQYHQKLYEMLAGIEEDEKHSPEVEKPQFSDALKADTVSRLQSVKAVLESNDITDTTLKDCRIPVKNRVSTTKSRQAVIARSPQCLAIHINRSLFDETNGMLTKNHAAVRFPQMIDLNDWCLGTQSPSESDEAPEQWETNPSKSMLPQHGEAVQIPSRQYLLRAIVTHYGRHENGHYICYRKYSTVDFPAPVPDHILQSDGDEDKPERWYQLSDGDVTMVSEGHVMSQGGAFMLFYEAMDDSPQVQPSQIPTTENAQYGTAESLEFENAESVSNYALSEDLSAPSTITDFGSCTSRATSVSLPTDDLMPIDQPIKPSGNQTPTERLDSSSMITA
jgi:ubiquitin carboxyl-terminal hydrolase 1